MKLKAAFVSRGTSPLGGKCTAAAHIEASWLPQIRFYALQFCDLDRNFVLFNPKRGDAPIFLKRRFYRGNSLCISCPNLQEWTEKAKIAGCHEVLAATIASSKVDKEKKEKQCDSPAYNTGRHEPRGLLERGRHGIRKGAKRGLDFSGRANICKTNFRLRLERKASSTVSRNYAAAGAGCVWSNAKAARNFLILGTDIRGEGQQFLLRNYELLGFPAIGRRPWLPLYYRRRPGSRSRAWSGMDLEPDPAQHWARWVLNPKDYMKSVLSVSEGPTLPAPRFTHPPYPMRLLSLPTATELQGCWELCRLHNNIGFWVVWLPTCKFPSQHRSSSHLLSCRLVHCNGVSSSTRVFRVRGTSSGRGVCPVMFWGEEPVESTQ